MFEKDDQKWKPFEVKNQITITSFYSMFEACFKTSYSFPGEYHAFWECLYVLDGTICVSGNERVYTLSKGEMIFYKPLEMHKFYVKGNAPARLFIFSFSAEGEMMTFFYDRVFRLSAKQKDIMKSLLKYVRREKNKAQDKISEYLYARRGKSAYLQTAAAYVTLLFLSLIDDAKTAPESYSPDAEIFKKAVKIMNEEIFNTLSIDDLASQCSISRSGLKRIFGKYAGLGVHEYFMKLKINLAARYLKSGKSVSQTAELLGFSGASYFSYAFKRETGISPSKYNKDSSALLQNKSKEK